MVQPLPMDVMVRSARVLEAGRAIPLTAPEQSRVLVHHQPHESRLTSLLGLLGARRVVLRWIVALIAEQRKPHAGVGILVHLANRLSRIEVAHLLIPRFVCHNVVFDSSGVVCLR